VRNSSGKGTTFMGYDLHITRKEDWTASEGPTITEAEWKAVIAADPDLKLDGQTRCVMADGEYIFAAWKGKPGVLGFYHGEITATDPEEEVIRKMVEIAGKLQATVQGDDGERYPEALQERSAPRSATPDRAPPKKASWWKRMLGG
jgi:hypothetical protein